MSAPCRVKQVVLETQSIVLQEGKEVTDSEHRAAPSSFCPSAVGSVLKGLLLTPSFLWVRLMPCEFSSNFGNCHPVASLQDESV